MTETFIPLSATTFYWVGRLLKQASDRTRDIAHSITLHNDSIRCHNLSKTKEPGQFDGATCQRIRDALAQEIPLMRDDTPRSVVRSLESAYANFDAGDPFRAPTPLRVNGHLLVRIPLAKKEVGRILAHVNNVVNTSAASKQAPGLRDTLVQHTQQPYAPAWFVVRLDYVQSLHHQLETLRDIAPPSQLHDILFLGDTLKRSIDYAHHEPEYRDALRAGSAPRKENPDMPDASITIQPSRSMASTMAYAIDLYVDRLPERDGRRHDLMRLSKRYFALSMQRETTHTFQERDVTSSLDVITATLNASHVKLKRNQREQLLHLERNLRPESVVPADRLPKNMQPKSIFSLKLHPKEAASLQASLTRWSRDPKNAETLSYYTERQLRVEPLLARLKDIAGSGDDRQAFELTPQDAALANDLLRYVSTDRFTDEVSRNIAAHALRLLRGTMQNQASLLELTLPDVTRLLMALKTAPGTPDVQTDYDRIRANIADLFPLA